MDGTYYMCETASDRIPDVPCTDLTVDGETPRIEEIGSGSLIAASVFDA